MLLEAVNGGVEECYINQKRIELEIRALTTTVIRFAKQTDQWLASSHALNTAIKVVAMYILSISIFLVVWFIVILFFSLTAGNR